jgi:hypothetical protein
LARTSAVGPRKTFQKGVLELVEKETAAWIAEFQSSVADLEKVVQAQRQATEASVAAALKLEAETRARLKTEEESAAAAHRTGAINSKSKAPRKVPWRFF